MSKCLLPVFVFIATNTYASDYTLKCTEDFSTSYTWKNNSKNPEIKTSKSKKLTEISIISKKGDYILVGNYGIDKLIMVDQNTLVQKPAAGIMIWKLMFNKKNNHVIVMNHKTYDVFGPSSFNTYYSCIKK